MTQPGRIIRIPPFSTFCVPKSGGIHVPCCRLWRPDQTILDVTIIYPDIQSPSFSDFTFGHLQRIRWRLINCALVRRESFWKRSEAVKEEAIYEKWLNER